VIGRAARPLSNVRMWPARYELLDGLRGLACLGVLLHHLGALFIGHYCVMIFFVISGYCITASAQSAIRARLRFGEFMGRRIRRIYPPYLAAVVFFVLTRFVRNAFHLSPVEWHASPIKWLQNLTLTQWVSDLWHPVHLPGDNPTLFVAAFWSLNYEEQFYLIVGLAVMLAVKGWLGLRTSVLALVASGMFWDFLHPNGPITGVFIEYWPHFALGACLFFALTSSPRIWPRSLFVAATGSLAVVSLWHILPWHGIVAEEGARRVYVEFAVLCSISIALLLLRPFSEFIARSHLWRPIASVGLISYSLYLIHQFNLTFVTTVVSHVLPTSTPFALQIAAKVCVHLLLATTFWYLFERPFLNHRAPTLDAVPSRA
jgi:peptidoglycan/LPS O-acetylase OafA/YrhL